MRRTRAVTPQQLDVPSRERSIEPAEGQSTAASRARLAAAAPPPATDEFRAERSLEYESARIAHAEPHRGGVFRAIAAHRRHPPGDVRAGDEGNGEEGEQAEQAQQRSEDHQVAPRTNGHTRGCGNRTMDAEPKAQTILVN